MSPMIRRVGRPGLLGLAARTAVVAGTASAVTGAMNNHRQQKQEQATGTAQPGADGQAQASPASSPATPAAAAPSPEQGAPAPVDTVAELQKLASLHQSGLLTDDEFAKAKAKLLG